MPIRKSTSALATCSMWPTTPLPPSQGPRGRKSGQTSQTGYIRAPRAGRRNGRVNATVYVNGTLKWSFARNRLERGHLRAVLKLAAFKGRSPARLASARR
eukprot:9461745-Alexandrium_andersonii.AAC.1